MPYKGLEIYVAKLGILVTNHRSIKYTTVGNTWKIIYFTCRFHGGAISEKVL